MAIPHWRPVSLAASCLAFAGCASQPADDTTAAATTPDATLESAPVEQPDATTADAAPTTINASIAGATPVANTRAPIATSPEITTTWVYLKDRYDADGDGIVTAAEYDRREGQFDRWDRDESGTLTDADFERGQRGSGGSGRGNSMSMGKTRRTLARYFQDDDDAGTLPLTEAQAAFVVYDGSDGTTPDGLVIEGEFTCSMEDRHREVPGDDSPMVQRAMGEDSAWANLIGGLDSDKDKALSADELENFYVKVMNTNTIDYSGWSAQGAPRRARPTRTDGRAAADDLAAQEGQKAPDFTLASPDGDTTATLSQHVGSKPVALIFGSYT